MSRYAITFGEVAILHIGLEEHGKRYNHGYSTDELREIADKNPDNSELIMLSDQLDEEDREKNDASVLILRNPLGKDYADKLLREQDGIEYDRKYYEPRFHKTLNKQARYNIVFGDKGVVHSDDYTQHSIIAFKSLPVLNDLRAKLPSMLGPKSKKLNAEGNHYYQKKSKIGFHGDTERKIVICVSLGHSGILTYQWKNARTEIKNPIDIQINHGDIYIMSEKATGYDCKRWSKIRLFHKAIMA